MSKQPHTLPPDGVELHDIMIASHDPGIELFLRNKRIPTKDPQPAILLVHGATYPSVSLFDVDVGGASVMDALALQGLDVWALDVRGYGGSTRLPEMAQEPSGAKPLVPAVEAVGDVVAAVERIKAIREIERIALLGMSWGGSLAGLYASRHQESLSRLILVAPLWLSAHPLRFDTGAPIMTHRMVDVSAYRAAWLAPVPETKRQTLLPDGWFERWREITDETDSEAPKGKIRAPSGAVADVRSHWTAGRPLYDPGLITTPVLMIRGEWDVDVTREMAADLFDSLVQAEQKISLEIGSATHMLLMEPVREAALQAIVAFTKGE